MTTDENVHEMIHDHIKGVEAWVKAREIRATAAITTEYRDRLHDLTARWKAVQSMASWASVETLVEDLFAALPSTPQEELREAAQAVVDECAAKGSSLDLSVIWRLRDAIAAIDVETKP